MQDPRLVAAALRAKYDVRGPRYTSYPPATHFRPMSAAELSPDYLKTRDADNDKPGSPSAIPQEGIKLGKPLSIYLHIPFCRSRCLFCGCHTEIARDESAAGSYVDSLIAEMELAAELIEKDRLIVQIALGGGTPNFLSERQLGRLLDRIGATWSISDRAELSVEIDPRTATPAKLDAFLGNGFNRFSLGVQDLEPDVLRLVRKGQDLMQVEEVISHLRSRGCKSINFDLIYGLPAQSLQTAARTVSKVIELSPSRIALYSYAHVPWIQPHQKVLERYSLPDPDSKLAIFQAMSEQFSVAGYESIGMDHFAKPDDQLAIAQKEGKLRRNFMGYTTLRGTDLLGLGASAISSVGSAYFQNEKDVSKYVEYVAKRELPIVRGFLLNRDDEIRRELIIDLFCNFAVDVKKLGERFGITASSYFAEDFARLRPLEEDGLVVLAPDAIRVSDVGRFFVRNICMVFDRYLEPAASARVYSRTV